MKKMNGEGMKNNNVRVVLECLRKNAPISRTDLAKSVDLTSATITNIVNHLLDREILVEMGTQVSERGRKPVLLNINASAYIVIGAAITHNEIEIVVTDFCANILYSNCIPFSMADQPYSTIDKIVGGIIQSIQATNIQTSAILGVGIAIPGPIDYRMGSVINPPNMPLWRNIPLRDILHERLGLPVYMDKETNAGALAEYYFGTASRFKTVFCINIYRVGVGGGLVVSGNVFHGYKDDACDIGHTTIDVNGPKCGCGNYGCLETLVKGNALLSEAQRELKTGRSSILLEYCDIDDLSVYDIFIGAREGDALCREIVERAARYVALGVGNIISMYSPQIIVFGGELVFISELFTDMIFEYVRLRNYPELCKHVNLVVSTLGLQATALGGVALVLDSFR